jgi:beta-lactamase regulating signal transducer with metallopeptidase domain
MKPNFSIFSDNLDYALGWMVIHSLWQATLIALISGVLMLFLRKKAAKTRYIVANVALMCVLVASAVTFCLYYDFSNDEGTITFTPAVESGLFDGQNIESTLAQINPQSPILNPNSTLKPQSSNLLSVEGFKDYFNRNLPMILVFWVLGVALFMLRLLGGLSYIYYLKNRMNFPADEYWVTLIEDLSERAGLKKGVELVESAMVRTPMVVGFLKPMILFPMGVLNRLSTEEVEAILAHELAHVLRNDYVFNILQSVVEALFYFHPAVWWMSAQIRNERESACDDIAINLIKNKMNYARALVAIQEMAYFPMTPALAFAGQRKSQFMMRMQRILNQPNNKTNVMEKLSATCLLLFLMIGLSFGSNLRTEKGLNATPLPNGQAGSVFGALDTIPSNSMYSNLPQSGDYNYEDNTQKVKLKVDEGKVKQLIVNGLEVPEKDIPNFSNLTEKILRKATPPPPPPAPSSLDAPESSDILSLFNEKNSTNSLGELAQIFDEEMNNGNLKVNEDDNRMTILNAIDGSTTIILFDNKGNQVFTTTDKKGNVSKQIIPKNGKSRAENYMIINQSKSKIGIITDDDKNYIISSKTNRSPSKNNDAYNTTRFKADNGYSYIVFDLKGEKVWKCYKNDMLLGDLIVKSGNQITYEGRKATSEELLNFGLVSYNNTLNPKTGGFQIITVEKRGEWNTDVKENNDAFAYSYHSDSDDGNDDNGDLQSDIQEFKSNVKELRNEIKTCDCTDNFDFRMGLMEELDRLFPAYKSQNRKVFSAFEKRYLDIKNRWEKGDCDDNKTGQNNTSNNLDARVKSIAKKAKSLSESIDDCDCNSKDPNWTVWAKARLGAEYNLALNNKNDYGLKMIENEIATIEQQFNRLKTQKGSSDCNGCPPGNGQQNYYYKQNGNSYSYGTGTSQADAQRAQKDAERMRDAQLRNSKAQQNLQESRNKAELNRQKAQAERDRKAAAEDAKRRNVDGNEGDKSENAKNSIFVNLKQLGYISLNKKCTVKIDKKHIEVDGKTLDNATFKRIYNEFEAKLGKKVTSLDLYFKGVFTEISERNVEMEGTSSSSLSTDD